MTNPIVRLYETERQARDAVKKLRKKGFPQNTIFLVTPGSGSEAGSGDALSAAIVVGKLLGSQAKAFAERVQRGRSLVVVRPPSAQSQLATDILKGCGPVDTDLQLLEPNQPAPFSDYLGLPTLARGRSRLPETAANGREDAAPLSAALNLAVLKRKRPAPFSDFLGFPTLSRGPGRLPVLTRKMPAPLSGYLGLATLSRGRRFMFGEPASSRFALSSLLGLSLLSRKAAPLSSLLKLKTTSRDPAPLSSKLGLPLLA
jgi:hypothetical protein